MKTKNIDETSVFYETSGVLSQRKRSCGLQGTSES